MSGLFEPKKVLVPGLPLMEATTDQVSQKASLQQEAARPPSDAALGFADKILQDSSRETSKSMGALGTLKKGLLFSPAGWMLEEAAKRGTLTPEQGKQVDIERAQDAVSREQRLTDRAAIRRELRRMTPEQAEQVTGTPQNGVLPASPLDVQEGEKRDTAVVQSARSMTNERLAAAEGTQPGVTQTWWLNATQVAARSGAQMGLDAAKYPFILWETSPLGRLVNGEGETSWGRAYIQSVEKGLAKALPGDAARSKDFLTDLSAGAGSFAGFLVAGYATGGMGALTLGATAQGSSMFEDAEEAGATELQKYAALLIGTGLGATEALPIDRMLMRANAATGGAVQRLLRTTAAGSMEEFIQEVGQNIGEDAAAKYLIAYDPDREMDALTYLKQGAIGGLLGGAGGAVTTAVAMRGEQAAQAQGDAQVAEEMASLMQDAATRMDDVQQRIDALLGKTPAVPEADASGGAGAVAEAAAPVTPMDPVRETLSAIGLEGLPEDITLPTLDQVEQALQAAGVTADTVAEITPEQVQGIAAALGLPDVTAEADIAMPRGGTMPEPRADGKIELVHWSQEPRQAIDPAMAGTGQLRGQELARLAGRPELNRAFYGVNPMSVFTPTPEKPFHEATDGYRKEGGVGNIRHVVAVDPNDLYNWYEDPLNIREGLDRTVPDMEQVTAYEQLIREAGFKGIYFNQAANGQQAVLFEAAVPESIIDDSTGRVLQGPANALGAPPPRDLNKVRWAPAKPAAFAELGARIAAGVPDAEQIFRAPGWAIVTAIQERNGPHDSPANRAALAQLEKELEGTNAIPVSGAYKGVDQGRSWIVFMGEKQAAELGARYGQESILTRKGLVFTDGTGKIVPAVHEENIVGPAAESADFYSTLPDGTAFTMGLNWDADGEAMVSAYHGSAARFDRFDSGRINTGEGAQAFGHGLYFASHKGIAEFYKDRLSANARETGADTQGALYEVAIDAEEEQFLDWDKPLSEQSDYVRQRLKDFAEERAAKANAARAEARAALVERDGQVYDSRSKFGRPLKPERLEAIRKDMDPGAITGQGLLRFMQIELGAIREGEMAKEAADMLKEMGIAGVRYLDAASRYVPEETGQTSNYVVFDDSIIDIVSIDGVPVAAAGKEKARESYVSMKAAEADLEADIAPAAIDDQNRISNRFPTQKQSTEDPLATPLRIDTNAMRAAPKAFEHNTKLLKSYPNWQSANRMRNPDAVAAAFVEHAKNNLLWLYDQVPDKVRNRTKLWYAGAREISARWGQRYELPDRAVAGVLAALSPQTDWYNNLSLAERTLDIVAFKGRENWSAAMDEVAAQYFPVGPLRDLVHRIGGRSLEALAAQGEPLALQALWVRVYDHAHHAPGVYAASPEGEFLPRTGASVAWKSLAEISKALSIIQDPSVENINRQMGSRHKIRNFYNNIIAPNSAEGDVTIDTHAVAAALLRPLSGSSVEVMHNFGQSPLKAAQPKGWVAAKNAGISGAAGTYGLYADAYRAAAEERGVLPREMQSITWEAVRTLYSDVFKRGPNAATIENLWKQYRNGTMELDQVRKEIVNVTGGIRNPDWYVDGSSIAARALAGRGAGPDGRTAPASYARTIPDDSVPVWSARTMGTGARADAAAEVPEDLDAAVVRTDPLPLFPERGDQSFDRWFGGSKVVNPDGSPKVVYHGTPTPGFRAFDPTKKGVTSVLFSEIETQRHGFFFAEDEALASTFAAQSRGAGKGAVIPAYLRVENPFDLRTATGDEITALYKKHIEPGYEGDVTAGTASEWEILDDIDIIAALKAEGYDGVVFTEPSQDYDVPDTTAWMVFENTQIKSAEENTGAYNPSDPDIYAQTAYSRGPYKAEQQRPKTGVAETGADIETASLSQIGQNLRDLMNLTIRQGRLTLRGAQITGQYQRSTGVIRLKNYNDLSTLVHEAGHHLNDAKGAELDAFIQQHKVALKKAALTLYGGDLGDAAEAKILREGFAEFFRVYVLNKAYADANLNNLSQDFDAFLQRIDKSMFEGLQAIREQYETFLTIPSLRVLRDQLVQQSAASGIKGTLEEMKAVGAPTWFTEFGRRMVKESVNRFTPLNVLVADAINTGERKTGAVIDMAAGDDPRVLARMARNSGSRANIQLVDGVVPYRSIHPASRGLREAFLLSQGLPADAQPSAIDQARQDDFDTFLVALRAAAEYKRFKDGKIARPPIDASIGDVQQTLADLTAKYGDSFARAAEIVDEYGRALWRKQYDAGLIDAETYKGGLDKDFYAPLARDMSDKKSALGDSVLANSKISKRFKGSDRKIISPMQVLMHKTFAVEQAIARNDTIKALAAVGARTGAGGLIEKVPAHRIVGRTYSVHDAAKKLLDDPGIDATEAADVMALIEGAYDPDAYIRLFQSEQALPLGENMLFYWDKGSLQAIQLPGPEARDLGKDVVTLLQGVGRETMPLGTEILAMTSTAFRSSITSWPDFLVVNFIRDQMSAWILTDVGYTPFVSGVKGMAEEVRQKGYARDYNAAMGVMGGMNSAAVHDARVNRDLNALRRRGYLAQMFGGKGFLGFAQGMAKLTELSETGTRVGLYEKAFKRAKADGLSDWNAAMEASYLATDYIDFGLNGTNMTLARRIIPFLNAQAQGLYKMVRTLGGDEARQRKGLAFVLKAYFKDVNNLPLSRREKNAIVTGRRAWVKMASLSLLGAALWALFRDDEDYQATSEYLRTTGWVIPLGDGRVAYIPKPFELAVVNNIVERALERASGDEEALNRLMRGVAQSLTPPTTPPLLGALIEHKANRDFFTNRELIPFHMQALEPELQYDERTSELAKSIGQMTGWSPMIVDHYLSSLGASAYRDITNAINAANPDRPDLNATDYFLTRRFVRDVRRGSTQGQDFWKEASTIGGELEKSYKSYRRMFDEGRDRAAADYLEVLDPDTAAYAVLHTHADTDAKRLHPARRTRDLLTVISGMRRELASEFGLERTDKNDPGEIVLTSKEKRELDIALSELASREMRNTLVLLGKPGWNDKRMLEVQPTVDIIRDLSPAVSDEFDRRLKKAKVYTFDFVRDNWPDARSRAIADGAEAFYDDLIAIGKAEAITGPYQ